MGQSTGDRVREDNFTFPEMRIGLNIPLASTSGNNIKITLSFLFVK